MEEVFGKVDVTAIDLPSMADAIVAACGQS